MWREVVLEEVSYPIHIFFASTEAVRVVKGAIAGGVGVALIVSKPSSVRVGAKAMNEEDATIK